MSHDEDESQFERALRADLPSAAEQARLRQRLFAAGLATGTGLAASSAASAQAGWGATVVAKVAALSWPMTLVLSAAVAAPVVALPIWLAPSKPAPASSASARLRLAPGSTPVRAAMPTTNPADVSAPPTALAAPLPPTSALAATPPLRVASTASAGVVTAGHAQEPAAVAASAPSTVAAAAFATPSSTASAPSARPTSTLAAETQLLDRAFAEIAAGHRQSAAALIAEHAQRFPNGLLSQERERARARLAQSSQGE